VVFIKALSQFSWCYNLTLYLFKIHFHIHKYTPFSSSDQNLVCISYLPHACNESCTFNWTWSIDINEISERFKIMLLIVQFSPSVCYFIPLLYSLVSKAKPNGCQALWPIGRVWEQALIWMGNLISRHTVMYQSRWLGFAADCRLRQLSPSTDRVPAQSYPCMCQHSARS